MAAGMRPPTRRDPGMWERAARCDSLPDVPALKGVSDCQKLEAVSCARRACGSREADQGEVWDAIEEKAQPHVGGIGHAIGGGVHDRVSMPPIGETQAGIAARDGGPALHTAETGGRRAPARSCACSCLDSKMARNSPSSKPSSPLGCW